MKKIRRKKPDALLPEYDFSKLGPGIRGKYYKRAIAGPIIIELRPDPDEPKRKKVRKRVARRTSRTK